MRVFFAFPVTDALAAYVRELRQALRECGVGGRMPAAAAPHITVLFVGEVSVELVAALSEGARRLCRERLPVVLIPEGPACFGRPARVLHAGLADPDGAFAALAGDLRNIAAAAGVEFPESARRTRAVAHITLARIRDPAVAEALDRVGIRRGGAAAASGGAGGWPPPPGPCSFERLVLYRSDLTDRGARHTAIGDFGFAPVGADTVSS